MLPLDTEMSKPNDLVQGTLDLLLLKLLALEPLHGWAISLRLRALSGDVLQVSEGSLYPALHKLERSEERRVGKECRSRRTPRLEEKNIDATKQNTETTSSRMRDDTSV